MAEPSHITNRNRGHRSRSRSYRPPIIKAEARLCPNCEKPISLGAFRCHHCASPITPFGSNQPVEAPESLFIKIADGKRVFAAYCIDGLIVLTTIATLVALFSQGENTQTIRGAHLIDSLLLWCAAQLTSIGLALFAFFAALLGYQCSSLARAGYTPGRRLAGIVLVHKKGRELSRTRLVIRTVLSLFSWVLLAAGYFWPLIDKYNRSLHDICTQTVLVERRLQIP